MSKLPPLIIGYLIVLTFLTSKMVVYASPSSENYKLQQYSFGGGSNDSESANYSVSGGINDGTAAQGSSTNYVINQGVSFVLQANTPSVPTFVNPASNYDRLKLIINRGNDPADTLYAVAISEDNFVTTRYIQNDYTIGPLLTSEDWLPYEGISSWGGSAGKFIRGLKNNTTYTVKVTAKQGEFTQSPYSLTASASTTVPSLSFGISSSSLNFDNLNSSNSYTDGTKSTVLTTSTNAYNGYTIYAHSSGPLQFQGNTIADFTSPNSNPTSWSGVGFGYTTNDSDLAGGISNRFTSGGAKYAGFTTSVPGDPVADHTQIVESSPVSNEQFTVSYQVSGDSNTAAGGYTTSLIYVVVPVY